MMSQHSISAMDRYALSPTHPQTAPLNYSQPADRRRHTGCFINRQRTILPVHRPKRDIALSGKESVLIKIPSSWTNLNKFCPDQAKHSLSQILEAGNASTRPTFAPRCLFVHPHDAFKA